MPDKLQPKAGIQGVARTTLQWLYLSACRRPTGCSLLVPRPVWSEPAKRTLNALVGQRISSLVARVAVVALDPAPVNVVAAGHQ